MSNKLNHRRKRGHVRHRYSNCPNGRARCAFCREYYYPSARNLRRLEPEDKDTLRVRRPR